MVFCFRMLQYPQDLPTSSGINIQNTDIQYDISNNGFSDLFCDIFATLFRETGRDKWVKLDMSSMRTKMGGQSSDYTLEERLKKNTILSGHVR